MWYILHGINRNNLRRPTESMFVRRPISVGIVPEKLFVPANETVLKSVDILRSQKVYPWRVSSIKMLWKTYLTKVVLISSGDQSQSVWFLQTSFRLQDMTPYVSVNLLVCPRTMQNPDINCLTYSDSHQPRHPDHIWQDRPCQFVSSFE